LQVANLLVVNVSVPVKWYSKRKHKHSSTRDSASRSVVSHDVVSTQDASYCGKWIIERKINDDGYKGPWQLVGDLGESAISRAGRQL
jgi:hypothetical protein